MVRCQYEYWTDNAIPPVLPHLSYAIPINVNTAAAFLLFPFLTFTRNTGITVIEAQLLKNRLQPASMFKGSLIRRRIPPLNSLVKSW